MNFLSILAVISISWQAPTENVDGSPLTDLAAYRVYYGEASRDYSETIDITDPALLNYDFTPTVPGIYFIAMTAIDIDGNESAYSNEITKEEVNPTSTFTLLPPTQNGSTSTEGTLLIGETGKEVSFSWESVPNGRIMELQLVRFGQTTPLLQGSSGTGSWRFTPSRAGLYVVRIRDQEDPNSTWISSNEMGLVFYFKLAAPDPGGLN